VIDPGSLQVNRRGRRVKTDRVDVKMLLRTLIAWCRGERHVWSLVRIPSVDEEDLRRSHRERSRLVRERTAHINSGNSVACPRSVPSTKRFIRSPVNHAANHNARITSPHSVFTQPGSGAVRGQLTPGVGALSFVPSGRMAAVRGDRHLSEGGQMTAHHRKTTRSDSSEATSRSSRSWFAVV
jgi:hypothetical protein